MIGKVLNPLVTICLLLFIAGCGEKSGESNLKIASDVVFGKEDYKKITDANNALGFNILAEVEQDENHNIFLSPTSLLMALSMVYNGADGVTKEEIAKTLHLQGVDVDELNRANASLMTMLDKNSEAIQLNVANSIWLNDKFHFQERFAQNNKDFFNAEIQEIDIQDNKSSKRINEWVESSTNGKIDKIVEDALDSDLVALLVNAIYFKGDWTYPFDEKLTEKGPFLLDDGKEIDVPLMTLADDLRYMENDQFQAVVLPYGEGETSMRVFLPNGDSTLDEFRKLLTTENWIKWNSEFDSQKGTVMLPRFQIEYETLLNESLEKLGMDTPFDENTADFSKMIKEEASLYISEVKQKAYIDVNEKGTEAAAVTSVSVDMASAPADDPFVMKVNRPFFFAITDDESETILFMGAISQPMQGK